MGTAIRSTVDLEYRRSVLVDASCERSYQAICDLGELLAHLPEVEDVTVIHSHEATVKVLFGPGLLDVRLPAETHLDASPLLHAVDLTAEIPALGARCRLSLELDCSDREQTLVQCTATMSCAHRRARLLRRSLMAMLERNVDVFITGLGARISRNARAERTFGPRQTHDNR